jgi:large subunit ribosomal protein L9
MGMNVILLERVNNLGDLGEEVSVKAGFARNFLLPKKKAVQANDANRAVFEERRKELEDAANEKLSAAKERAEALNEYLLTIQVKAGEEDRLFGSVGTQDIADALVSKGLEVERSEVRLPDGAIRVLGEYEVDIQLHSDVTATIHLHVVAE